MAYKNYLKSNHWKEMKATIYARGHRKCAICGREYGLNVHHMTYKRLNKEKFIDLLVLCTVCHKKYHDGIIPEEALKFVSRNRKRFNQPTDCYGGKKPRVKPGMTEKQMIKKLGTIQYHKLKREGGL